MERAIRLSDSALWLIIGSMVQAVSGLLLVLVLVRIMPKEQFGNLQWMILLMSTVASVATLGIPQSYLYFMPRIKRECHKTFLIQGLTFQGAVGLIGGLCAALFAWYRPGVFGGDIGVSFFIAVLLYPTFAVISASMSPIMLSLGRPKYAAYVAGAVGVFSLSCAVATATIVESAADVFLAYTSATGLAVALGVSLMYRSVMVTPGLRAERRALWEQLSFSIPLWASSIVGDLNRRIDGIIVRAHFPPAVFASFSVGAREIPFVGIFAYNITQAILPRIAKCGLDGDRLQQIALWHQAMVKTAMVLFPTFVLCLVFAEDIVVAMFTASYADATPVFMIYLLLLPLRLSGYGAVLSAMGRPNLVLRGALLGLIVNVLTGLTLVALIGWTGPAIGSVVSQIAMILYLCSAIKQEANIAWTGLFPWVGLARIVVIAVVPVPVAWMAAHLFVEPLPRIIIGGMIFAAGYGALAWVSGVMTSEDRATIRRWVRLGNIS